MNLSDTIYNEVKRLYDSFKTQERVAAKCNVNQGRIQKILSQPGYCKGMKIETVEKMFPNSMLNLNGNITTSQTGTNNVVVNGECGTVNNGTPHAQPSADQIRARIIAALIPLDIPPESLQAVLRTINELNLN